MPRPQPRTKKKVINQDWLLTYGDVVTLLMAFFVVLMSVSKIDQNKIEQMQSGLSKDIFKSQKAQPFSSIYEKLKKIIKEKGMEDTAFVTKDSLGVKISFSSNVLYNSGSATVKSNMLPVLKEIALSITELSYKNYVIRVEGHTDDIPIKTVKYPSNWELSASRSTYVVRYLNENGIPKERLVAAGLADSRPVAPNVNEKGVAIPKNRAANRRIEIYIRRMDRDG